MGAWSKRKDYWVIMEQISGISNFLPGPQHFSSTLLLFQAFIVFLNSVKMSFKNTVLIPQLINDYIGGIKFSLDLVFLSQIEFQL